MKDVLLELIAWGKDHYILFGWTLFWSALIVLGGTLGIIKALLFVVPNRILRTVKVLVRGWPPIHLDADGDWKPIPKVSNE